MGVFSASPNQQLPTGGHTKSERSHCTGWPSLYCNPMPPAAVIFPESRRALLKAGAGLVLAPLAFAQENPAVQRPQPGDLLVRAADTPPLKPADISAGAKQLFVWAMDPASKVVRNGTRLNRILLVRPDTAKLASDTASRAVDGVVAYSAVCPHNGCEVNEWIPEEQALFCGCHASKFQPADSGKVLDGPAPNMLPALPLKLTDGLLTVAMPFTARITFEQGDDAHD